MTTTTTHTLPYRKRGEIDYDRLEFDPHEPVRKPDAMEQNPALLKLYALLYAYLADFGKRPDIFLDVNTIICYDPANLNVRVSPDLYIALGVESDAIRSRKIYLPWEVGKPPDFVMEIASYSTGREDIGRKRRIYAQIGVPEYWRFDPTGGDYHGVAMAGDRLIDGEYRPISLTTEPDGILKGYSDALGYSLCWDDGEPLLYDPTTGVYLDDWRQTQEDLLRMQDDLSQAQSDLRDERSARLQAEAELRRLRDQFGRR